MSLARGPRVAGKATQVLHLRPRDTLRLGHVLALEEQSGVVLRSDTISEKGELLERHEFATLTISKISDSANSPSTDSAVRAEGTANGAQEERPRYVKVPGLPDGYRRASLARGYEGRALFVSDGIAAAAVIFEPLPGTVKPGRGGSSAWSDAYPTPAEALFQEKHSCYRDWGSATSGRRVIADAVKLTAGQR